MNNIKTTSITFSHDWTFKLTTYKIRYRIAYNTNDVDESFCAIINAKGGRIIKEDFAKLLGFDLHDIAENDIFYIYLNNLREYNLIEIDNDTVNITEHGSEALRSKLKFKYFFASVQLVENHDVIGEGIDFPFKDEFGICCDPVNGAEPKSFLPNKNPKLQNKLQFQLFENNIYKGEVMEIAENNDPQFSYITYDLQCRTTFLQDDCQIKFYWNDSEVASLDQLIKTSENSRFREELIRQGRFYWILANSDTITAETLRTYTDLCDWQALSENLNVDWKDPEVFEVFKLNGDGSVWKQLSEKVPIECIKAVVKRFEEYWSWSVLSRRLENSFIKNNIHSFNWDFEELSYKNVEFVMDLLSSPLLKERDWDWNYLSKNLPDEFIEEKILDFNWDFYVITTTKNEVFKNVFRKNSQNLDVISEKPWNWKYVSKEININFLYNKIDQLAPKIEWPTILYRFFNDQDLISKCLNNKIFSSLLKSHLPNDFRVSEQKYLWSVELINFLEDLNLINWETRPYMKGLDTNEWVEWNEDIFTKYQGKIVTHEGFASVSENIMSGALLESFPHFDWDWEGVSNNKDLFRNPSFTENAFSGKTYFTDELHWHEIFSQSSYDLKFWNKNLSAFYKTTNTEKNLAFWELLTKEEEIDFIFSNPHYPWDWRQVTKSAPVETILESLDYDDFIAKWDWEIATQKLEKGTILENLENLSGYIDWSFVIHELFSSENELRLDRELPRIAACLSNLADEKRKRYWKELTAAFPFPQLFSYVTDTQKLSVFEWDWNLISSHKHFPTDLKTINRFKNHLNWPIFSGNVAILQKFDFCSWDGFGEWFRSTDTYLSKFASHWDWKILSQNDELTYNRQLLAKYRNEDWDWEYLSEFGSFLKKQNKDKEDYLEKIIKDFPNIDFSLLSRRTDIYFGADFILSTKDKEWDWQVLSDNKKAEITGDLILELKDKNWNWKAISNREDVVQNNETLLDLIDKDWDWQILSQNEDLVFNKTFMEKTRSKPWDWRAISRHKSFSPNVETLVLTKNFDLDWDHLSQHPKMNPTRELLSKFEEKWNWYSITQNDRLNFSDTDFLLRFVNRWNWSYICESGNLLINKKTLTLFKKHLDWDLISANTSISFTEEIIQEFAPYWNWTNLKQNKRVEELLGDYVVKEVERSAMLSFLDKIEKQYSPWKGSIYHFTHIDNAVEIIKNRKIQSRNRANIKGDAAGNVVHRRGDAHDYARFYFRPQTPTQFYNEFLGKDSTDKYYDRARNLGFPKCPLPIFFQFSLKEVLFKNDEKCCVSNGNMQKTATCFNPIEQMLSKFNFEFLYSDLGDDWENYMNYAQQEFLVRNELSFNELLDFKIVCASYGDKNLLINLLGEEQQEIFSKIVVDANYYNFQNPRINIEEKENSLSFSTNFYGDGYFVLSGSSNMRELEVVSGDLNSIEDDEIIFKSNITVENKWNQDLTLRFVDESNRNWFIYSTRNSAKKCRHGITSETDKNLVWR